MSLTTTSQESNGLKTKINATEDGTVFIQAICETKTGKKMSYNYTLDTILDWYPFYFNYDYRYVPVRKDIFLFIDKDAPEAIKDKYVVEKNNRTNFKLRKLVNPETGERAKAEDNPVLTSNLALVYSLAKYDFKLVLDDFTKEDVKLNYGKIKTLISMVKTLCLERLKSELEPEIAKGDLKIPDDVLDSEDYDKQIYQYLSDDEAKLLAELGAMFRMTQLMDRIVTFKNKM